jgi:hypothetical protein
MFVGWAANISVGIWTPLSQVGKGLLKDENAQKLALQHWLEAVRNTI